MKRFSSLVGGAALAIVSVCAQAQEKDNKGINPLSVREINESDILMKRTLWRRLDLKEKQNQPMFARGSEITKYILDAVKAGLLDPYQDDQLVKKLTPQEFSQKLQIPVAGTQLTADEIKAGFSDTPAATDGGWGDDKKKADPKAAPTKADDGWGSPKTDEKKTAAVDDGWGAPAPKKNAKGKKGKQVAQAPKPVIDSTEIKKKMAEEATAAAAAAAAKAAENEYFPDQLSVIELKEDFIFDKKRSRLYYDIQTVTIAIPSDVNPNGLETPVATFRYKDLDKLFRSDPKKFIWFNEYNTAQHKNLADAFDLRLFNGRIIKYSNPMNDDLVKMYGGEKEAMWKSVQIENELMELEHNLWEY
jgi:gliding motility associated protien GldN